MKDYNAGTGKRREWEFEYAAAKLMEGAAAQKDHRISRVKWWTEAKQKVMAEVRETGIEVSESIAAGVANYTKSIDSGPQVMVRADLQKKLTECHMKIMGHQQAADEYEGWIQVMRATNPETRFKLTQADWLYFFGK